jgi:hypothetical protein
VKGVLKIKLPEPVRRNARRELCQHCELGAEERK